MITRKECLRDLIKSIYGNKTIDYTYPDHENKIEIKVSGKTDLTTTCTYTLKYEERFRTLFEYTFSPRKNLHVYLGRKELDVEALIKNVLVNLVGIKEINEIVRLNQEAGRRLFPLVGTSDSLLQVLKNTDEYSGIPVCYNEEQLEEFNDSPQLRKAVWDKMHHSEYPDIGYHDLSESDENTSVDKDLLDFADFCNQYRRIFPELAKNICHDLNDYILPVLFKNKDQDKAISKEDDIDEMYKAACERFKERLLEHLRFYIAKESPWNPVLKIDSLEQLRSFIDGKEPLKGFVKSDPPVVIIDSNYSIEELNVSVSIGIPVNTYLVSDWKVPACRYGIQDKTNPMHRIFEIPVLQEQVKFLDRSNPLRVIEYLTYLDEQEKELLLASPSKEKYDFERKIKNAVIGDIITRYSYSIG